MYEVGDLIIYGCEGVCKVEGIGLPDISSLNRSRLYYTLSPVYMNEKVYTPVDSSIFMRAVISREEAVALVEQMPSIQECAYENCDLNLLKEQYRTMLQSHDCTELIKLIKTIYTKRQLVNQKGNKLSQVDDQYLKQAEELLYGELSVALGIPKNSVVEYIGNAIDKTGR